jgi:hypothetical protein
MTLFGRFRYGGEKPASLAQVNNFNRCSGSTFT